MNKFVVMAKRGASTVLREYYEIDTVAELMFEQCLAGDEGFDTVAWGRVVCDGTNYSITTPESVDWFKWIDTPVEAACDTES